MDNNGKLLDYFLEINNIKNVKRYTPYHQVYHESVADHSFLIIVLAVKFIDELKLDLDFKKVIKLAVHHDFDEIGLRADFDAAVVQRNSAYRAKKETYRHDRISQLANKHGSEIMDLHTEYIGQKTREAKFVKALDKIETTIHQFNKGAENLVDLDFTMQYADQAVENFPELLPFYRELKKFMRQELINAGHEWRESSTTVIKSERSVSDY